MKDDEVLLPTDFDCYGELVGIIGAEKATVELSRVIKSGIDVYLSKDLVEAFEWCDSPQGDHFWGGIKAMGLAGKKWQEGEERMSNIAQNGNNGGHYVEVGGVSATLEERGSRYGSFIDGSNISQGLKDIVRSTPNWDSMESDKKQSIEFFMDKISRILSGDSDYIDNWHDIGGYAKLVEDRLTELEKDK